MPVTKGFEHLSQVESMRLLATQAVGRIAMSVDALPSIFPVNFAVVDGDIIFRTGEGAKLTVAALGSVVAFQTDHSDPIDHTGWSVQVQGIARLLEGDEHDEITGAIPVVPWAPGHRSHYIRIVPEIVSGRRITIGQ